jgi:predicted nucleotidyltransferase
MDTKYYLEELLESLVDLVTPLAIKPRMKPYILFLADIDEACKSKVTLYRRP